MTKEEICKHLQDMLDDKDCHGEMTGYQEKAVEFAITDLRAQAETECNKPLTLDELRKMDGEPVWVEQPNDATLPFWGIVDAENELVSGSLYCATFEDYDTEWLAYRHKPMEDTKGAKI